MTLVEFMIALSIYVLAVELAIQPVERRGASPGGWLAAWSSAWYGFCGRVGRDGLLQSNVPLALLFQCGHRARAAHFYRGAGSCFILVVQWGVQSKLRPVPVYALGDCPHVVHRRGLETTRDQGLPAVRIGMMGWKAMANPSSM